MRISLHATALIGISSIALLTLATYLASNSTVSQAAPPAQATDVPAMVKDADVLTAGVQDANNLWLMQAGCVDADAGQGCLVIDDNLSGIYDVDDSIDSDTVPEGLGAWQTEILFDDESVTLNPVGDKTWLESAGNTAGCGSMTLSPGYMITYCSTSVQGPNGPESPSGRIMRIYVTPKLDLLVQSPDFRPAPDNGHVTNVTDVNCEICDTLGEPIAGSLPGGLTSVCSDAGVRLRVLEGDMNMDCQVGTDDASAAAAAFGSTNPWYDVATKLPDGDIDVFDVQSVWHRLGSICQSPFPAYQSSPAEAAPTPVPPPESADASLLVTDDGPEQVTASLQIADIPSPGIGAIEVTMSFDHDVVEPIGVTDTSGLESGGRIASCQLGHYPYYDLQRGRVGIRTVSYACVTRDSSDTPGSQSGVTGTSTLASFKFHRLMPGATGIKLAAMGFSAPSGSDMVFEDPPAVGGVAEMPELDVAAPDSSRSAPRFVFVASAGGVALALVLAVWRVSKRRTA